MFDRRRQGPEFLAVLPFHGAQRGGIFLTRVTKDFPKPTIAQVIVGFLFLTREAKPPAKRNDRRTMNHAMSWTLRTEFEPGDRFEVETVPAVPFRGTMETELDRLKDRLLKKLLAENLAPELNAPLRRAANEAASRAWMTAFPLLVFPTLLEELAQKARLQIVRQERIRIRSHHLVAEAA
jgi:hypothetical protein